MLTNAVEAPQRVKQALALEDVRFTYPNGGVLALEGVTLDVAPGRSLGVIGPSGCGKSTILALLANFQQPDSGTIYRQPAELGRHPMTMVFQGDTLLPWRTVADNVRLFFRFNKANKREVDEKVKDLIHLAHLDGFEHSYPHQLSGGMRKRVAFLAAVVPSPQILLLDEPFSSLDEPTRVALHQDVLRITQQLGMTVVLVTHDLAEAITLCDEVAILTNRPATVASRRAVPFGRERDVMELRQEPEFLQLYGSLWSELSEQIGRHRKGDPR